MVSAKKKRKKITDETVNTSATPYDWLHQVAFWGLALLLFFPPYFRGLFFAPEQEKALILACLVFWVAFIRRWLQGDHKFLATPMDWFALALPVVYILSSFVAVNKGLAIQEVVKNILYFLTFWSVSRLVRHEKDAENILKVIYISAVGVALAGLATATGIVDIKDGIDVERARIHSSFQYSNSLAAYLGAVFIMGLYFWDRALDRHKEVLGLAQNNFSGKIQRLDIFSYLFTVGNFLLLAVLLGTKSRGGLLVFALVILVYLLMSEPQKRLTSLIYLGYLGTVSFLTINKFIPLALEGYTGQAWVWAVGGLVFALVGQALFEFLDGQVFAAWQQDTKKFTLSFCVLVAIAVIGAGVFLTINSGIIGKITDFNYLITGIHRIYYMDAALDMIKERPILGWGGGGWQEAYRAFLDFRYTTRQVHSYYFQVLIDCGILGLLPVIGVWGFFLYRTHILFHGSREEPLRRRLILTLTMVFLMIAGHALIDFDLSLSAITIVLWSIFGIVMGLSRGNPEQEVKPDLKQRSSLRYVSLIVTTVTIMVIMMGDFCLMQSRSLMRQGVALLRSQQTTRGVDYLQQAISYNPFEAEYHLTLSQIYSSLKKNEMAVEEAEKAVSLSRYDIVPRMIFAKVAIAAGDYDKGIEAAEKMVDLAPSAIENYENLVNTYSQTGIALLKEGNKEQARELFEKIIKVPDMMNSQLKKISNTEEKMWVGPRLEVTSQIKVNLGIANYWLGDWVIAQSILEETIKDAEAKDALIYLSLIKQQQGQDIEAQELLNQAIKISATADLDYERLKSIPTLRNL